MSYRVFITGSGIAEEALQYLHKENCLVEIGEPADTPEDLANKFREFNPDGIIVRQGKITEDVQRASKNLKVLCKHGVGIDNIDVEAATRRGIPVMFTPLANYESVAEHTVALMLSLIRRIPIRDKSVRAGIFDRKNYDGLELLGKTLGIIGFGKIGRRFCELILPFHMNVLVYHPSRTVEKLSPSIMKVDTVEQILDRADIISLHCPLTPETKGMINRQCIDRMKQGVFIINTARGGLINEYDLSEALQNGRIGGAALDVFENEPPDKHNPLFTMENVILSSHIANTSDNSFKNMGMGAAQNVVAVLKGEPINMESLINKEIVGR